MRIRTVLDGNAFYDIDEDCLEQRKKEQEKQKDEEQERNGERRQNRRKMKNGGEKTD